jgi:hypothetical protein
MSKNNLLASTKKKIQQESIAALTTEDKPIKKRLNVELDEEMMKKFKGRCGLEGKKINEVIVSLIDEYLKK